MDNERLTERSRWEHLAGVDMEDEPCSEAGACGEEAQAGVGLAGGGGAAGHTACSQKHKTPHRTKSGHSIQKAH